MSKRISDRIHVKRCREDLTKIKEVLKLVYLAELFRHEVSISIISNSKVHSTEKLKEFCELILPRSNDHKSFTALLSSASEHILRYLNHDNGKVVGTTYSGIWDLIGELDCCGYFDNSPSGKIEKRLTTVESKTGNGSKSSTAVCPPSSSVQESISTVESKTGIDSNSSTSTCWPSGYISDTSYTLHSTICCSTHSSTAVNSFSANIAGNSAEVLMKSSTSCVTTVITKNSDNLNNVIAVKEQERVQQLDSPSFDHKNEEAGCIVTGCDHGETRIYNSGDDDDEDNGEGCDETMDCSNKEIADVINNGDVANGEDTSDDCDVANKLTDCNISEVMNIKLEATDTDLMRSVSEAKNDVIDTVSVERQVFDDLVKADNQSPNILVDCDVLVTMRSSMEIIKSLKRTCPYCARTYSTDHSLKNHLLYHSSEKLFSCVFCPRRFYQKGHLTEHVRRVHYTHESPYICMCCELSFISASLLRRHLKKHDIHLEKPCNRKQNPSARFRCDICSRELSCNRTLDAHRRLHSGEKTLMCAVCGKTFHDPAYFWRHRQTHEPTRPKQSPLTCATCGRLCADAQLLRSHQRTHSSLRPYPCTKCEMAFKRPSDLRQHERTHSGHKPYSCGTCGASFTQAHSLQFHIRIHTNERPHTCSVCSKSFRKNDNLRVHMRIHTGERPHACHLCPLRFADKSALRRHVSRHNTVTLAAVTVPHNNTQPPHSATT